MFKIFFKHRSPKWMKLFLRIKKTTKLIISCLFLSFFTSVYWMKKRDGRYSAVIIGYHHLFTPVTLSLKVCLTYLVQGAVFVRDTQEHLSKITSTFRIKIVNWSIRRELRNTVYQPKATELVKAHITWLRDK